jgi:hypothetical protein
MRTTDSMRARLAALLLTGSAACGFAQAQAGAKPPAGTWHTRLAYHVRSTGPTGLLLDTQVFVTVDQPAACRLERAASADCTAAGPARSQGHVYAEGQFGDGSAVQETYRKKLSWTAPAADGMRVNAGLPAPSHVGTGLAASIDLQGMVQGVARQVANGAGGSAARDRVSVAQPRHTRPGDASGRDPFELKLSFDPDPGQPSAPQPGDLPQRMRDALNRPEGEFDLAVLGTLIGAETGYDAGGHAWLCYTRKLAGAGAAAAPGAQMTIEVGYCGWLTQGADTWAPKQLPPPDRDAP